MDSWVQELSRGESESLEFKRSTASIREAVQTLCAFANQGGGVLYFGVADDGSLVGQEVSDDTLRNLANAVKLNTDPKLYPQIRKVEIGGKTCIRLTVEQSPLKPHTAYGRAYLRVGTSTQQLSQDQYRQMIQQQSNGYGFDALLCRDARLSDIDESAVHAFLEAANAVRDLNQNLYLPVDQVLEKLDLVKNGAITNAAVLLFATDPRRFFRGCYEIKAAIFPSDSGYDTMLNAHEFAGNLLSQVARVLEFLVLSLQKSYSKGDVQGVERLEFPMSMLREALVNMIAHRDFRVGVKSTIELRPSSLLFYNPAELFAPTITLESLKRHHASRPGNRLIARVLYLMGFFENWGGGTLKIIEEARNAASVDPEFGFRDGMFSLVIHRRRSLGV